MSTHRIVPAAVAAAFALITALPADAKPNAKPPKVKPAKATTVKATGPKTVKAKPTTVKVQGGSQAKAVKPAKAKSTGKPTTTKTSVDVAKGSGQKVKGDKSKRTAVNDPTAPRAGSQDSDSTSPRPAQLSKAQQQLVKNDNLRAKLAARLGGNIDPVLAASGFKNLGQFVAAVNVSHNQGIDFKDLKLLMLGDAKMSLGQAIKELRGGDLGSANAAAARATTAADQDLAATTSDAGPAKQKTRRSDRS